MQNTLKSLLAAGALAAFAVPVAHADDGGSGANMSEALIDSADASARIVASGGQVMMGAVAVPLALAGGLSEATGAGVTDISETLWDGANAPLVVDDAVVMAQPAPSVPRTPGEAAPRATNTGEE